MIGWPLSPMGLGVAVLLGSVVLLVAGFWAGTQWQAGRMAQAEQRALLRELDALSAATQELRRRGLEIAADFRAAQVRFETTAEGLNDDLAAIDAVFQAQRASLEDLLALHPDWVDCHIGADGLHAWNAAATGAEPAAAATAQPADTADAAVPGQPACAAARQSAGPAAQLPAGCAAVPPLPLPALAPDAGAGEL